MNPILQNLVGMTFLLTAESGILIQNFGRNTGRERIDVYDASLGYDVGFCSHNPTGTYNIKGRTTSALGLAAAAPGISLAIANLSFGNGVGTTALNAGGIYTDTVALEHAEKEFRALTITATQKPGIP